MSNDAGGTSRLADSLPNGVGLGRGMLTASPYRLIRTMEGRITSWSSGMQRRYGFTRRDARGQTAHHCSGPPSRKRCRKSKPRLCIGIVGVAG
jgi:hypothetical protein